MCDKRDDRPDVNASERSKELKACTTVNSPTDDFTTISSSRQPGRIESLLSHGSENAVVATELIKLTGHSTIRALQHDIAGERNSGSLILSSSAGYFLPSSGDRGQHEITAFLRTCRSRALNTLRMMRPAKKAVAVIDGQFTIDDADGGGER